MTKHFRRELKKIKKQILTLGSMVEELVQMAVIAVENQDAELANQIIKKDLEIDEKEVEIEEDCLKVLALHQPVAIDLRFLIAVIKINNDLERIGDQAVNIAQRIGVIAKREQLDFFFDYSAMGEKAQTMLKMSLDALINLDDDIAWKVLQLEYMESVRRLCNLRVNQILPGHGRSSDIPEEDMPRAVENARELLNDSMMFFEAFIKTRKLKGQSGYWQ